MVRREQPAQKQVQLTVFNNEPEAQMAEQRLFQEGIPCVTRALGGGPGLWGSAFNLPHGVYVQEGHATRAREVLGLTPDSATSGGRSSGGPEPRVSWAWVALAVVIAVTLLVAGSTLRGLFGG